MNIFIVLSFPKFGSSESVNYVQFQKIASPVSFCINRNILRVTDNTRRCPSAGPVVLSSPAQLVAPVLVARGTLSITTSEMYFEVDEDEPAFKRADAKVRTQGERLYRFSFFNRTTTNFT